MSRTGSDEVMALADFNLGAALPIGERAGNSGTPRPGRPDRQRRTVMASTESFG
jgi:hypothetical protein